VKGWTLTPTILQATLYARSRGHVLLWHANDLFRQATCANASMSLRNEVGDEPLSTLPTATGAITRLAYECAQRAGIEPLPILRKAGLTFQEIQDRDARFAVSRQIEFLKLTADALGDRYLGFHLAQSPDLRGLGLLFYIAASSDTLGQALERAARYTSIVNEGVSLSCRKGHDVRVVFEYVGVARYLDRHQIEFLMTALIRLCRQLTGLRLTPSRVRIAHRRFGQQDSQLASYFGGNITFGAKVDEVTFAMAKDLPVTSADPYLNALLIANCEKALAHRRLHPGAYRVAVANAIAPLLPHGNVLAPQVAIRLGLSQRTLARRLAMEGVTFSEVLKSLRGDLARQYLSDRRLSVSRIAWLLGYQEVSAFTHAFKRWSGKTPREARTKTN
jgi:AraC-like DNA-binding protein